ncbi:alpha/beta-hydrolase, partial [Aspergillus indologenus CBS 114.80]
ICGSALYLDWFPRYLLELAQSTPAVLLAPNYRLLPEATLPAVFSDVLDFWAWVRDSPAVSAGLATVPTAAGRLAIDRARVLVAGGSAGGYLSLCLALRFPEQIRGAVVGYPAFLGLASSFVEVSAVAGGGAAAAAAVSSYPHRSPVRTFTDLPDRLDLMDAAMRTGRIAEMFARGVDVDDDPERSLRYPMERLDESVKIPRGGIAILHGREDEVVSVEDSVRFVGKAKMVLRAEDAGRVAVTVREGGHGFDTPVGLGEGWLWESLRGVVGGWLE